ncbi:hypothetical protein OOJ91_33500 [Micromonospora lupini]|nr:hypothetical protein [Micromonospora lupini]MCX5070762.1 hypothetical protein [Micromonospora lupini]
MERRALVLGGAVDGLGGNDALFVEVGELLREGAGSGDVLTRWAPPQCESVMQQRRCRRMFAGSQMCLPVASEVGEHAGVGAASSRSRSPRLPTGSTTPKAAIAGVAVGLAVGVGCGFAIGATGAGAVACGALAGAAANMVTYAIETKVEHKGNVSLGGMLVQGAIGAVVGGVMGGLGSVGSQALKAGVSSMLSGAGARASTAAAGAAAKKEAGAIVNGLTRNAFTKSATKAAQGASAGRSSSMAADYDPAEWKPTVTHENGATGIGNDPNTAAALRFAPRIPGIHNVVIHGNADGFADGTAARTVAAAVRANPSYTEVSLSA